MSLEKLYSENEQKEKSKKSLESREKFLEEQKILRESSDLLQSLSLKISQEFGIDISEVKEFIKWNTLGNLEWLRDSVGKNINSTEFKNAILQARESVSKLSRKNRDVLKKMIEESDNSPENFRYHITDTYFSKYKERALDPKNFSDHILWVWLGILDTTEAVILFLYGLGKWILFTPYHLYLIISGKGQFDDWNKI